MVILASLLLLLVVASAARADCSWVLSSNTMLIRADVHSKDVWSAVVAKPTYTECQVVLAGHVRDSVEPPSVRGTFSQSRKRPLRFMDEKRAIVYFTNYSFLPDTIDPRGPKEVK